MKKIIVVIGLLFSVFTAQSQSCNELMESIKAENYGTTYSSYTSDAISEVTFYEVLIDYQARYFAIVCFKSKYSYGCTEYVYQVAYDTKLNYSLHYLNSAGKAFWKYIQPYNGNLDCAPNFD